MSKLWGGHRPFSPVTQSPGFSVGEDRPHPLFVQTLAFQGLLSLTFCAGRQCVHAERNVGEQSLGTAETFHRRPNLLLSTILPRVEAEVPMPTTQACLRPQVPLPHFCGTPPQLR